MYIWNDGTDVLMHHGIKGQKWGVRRFQNPDMTYTEAGKQRYSWASRAGNTVKKVSSAVNKVRNFKISDNQKKAIKIGAAVVGTALVAYGAYKVGTSPEIKEFIKRGRDIIADTVEQQDIKKRIRNEIRDDIQYRHRKDAMKIDSYTSDKLDDLYKQIEKVNSVRTKENSAEADHLISELLNVRKSIITERNEALKDVNNSLRLEGAKYGMLNSQGQKYISKLIKQGKNVDKYNAHKIVDLINRENATYDLLVRLGEDPDQYGIIKRGAK